MLNLVIVLGFTFTIALLLIYFVSAHDRKRAKQISREPATLATDRASEFRLFAQFCSDLTEYLKLEIKNFEAHGTHEVYIRAVNVNPITRVEYLVFGLFLRPDETVDAATILAFSDQIISERISKGLFVTPATISDAAKNLPELAPIDFIDGAKFVDLKNKIIL